MRPFTDDELGLVERALAVYVARAYVAGRTSPTARRPFWAAEHDAAQDLRREVLDHLRPMTRHHPTDEAPEGPPPTIPEETR